MKKILKILIMLIIVFVLTTYSNISFASKKTNLQNKQDKIDEEIDNKKEQLDDIKDEKSETLDKVEKLIENISSYQDEIDELNNKISDLNSEIKDIEKQIKEDEKKYEEQQKALDERLVAMYKTGETSYLDVLLSSASLADFISSYYLISEVTDYDTKMIEQVKVHKNKIENDKNKLESNKQEINNSKKTVESKQQALEVSKKEKENYAKKLSAEEKEIQKELEQFERDKKQIEAELRKIAQEESKKKGYVNLSGKPSACGYISPIPGVGKGGITCGFYGYSGHGGVDFAGHYSSSVVAVKSGTVITSKAASGSIRNYDSSGKVIGSYSSYGEHIIINHHDGTMTLYAHGLPGSRRVTAGQEVKQGQVIMQVGNTGNVRPRPSASNYKGGAHLHFEVRVNGTRVNPTAYLP